jgi:hypothetical protein
MPLNPPESTASTRCVVVDYGRFVEVQQRRARVLARMALPGTAIAVDRGVVPTPLGASDNAATLSPITDDDERSS